jgi:ectoine hydroxylase-related dioxygenase (phytanoyl-CoA dioxygenase family)
MRDQIDKNGFAMESGVFSAQDVAALKGALEPFAGTGASPGIRDLITKSPAMLELARSAKVRKLVESVLGCNAAVVRSIFFNKSAQSNWQVAWHQDLSIAVTSKSDVPGFAQWSVKENIPHVQPPVELLEQMLTLRIHLDPADETNGALWVVSGSHRLGRVPADKAASVAQELGKQVCSLGAGDVMLFRPLVLHASKKSTSGLPRRVIHFEFAATPLPAPLAWREWVAVC